MRNKNIMLALLASLLINLFSQAAVAQKRKGIHPFLTDTFKGSLGWFSASNNTRIRVDGPNNPGGDIDFENDLNFDDKANVWLADFKWRFTQNFHLSMEYVSIKRDADAILDKDVSWDDLTFKQGTNVHSNFDIDVYRAFVGYSFLNGRQYELGAGLGLHLMRLSMDIAGQAFTNQGDYAYQSDSVSVLAPLPNIGVYGTYALSERFAISAKYDWMSANVNDYNGGITSASADLQYQWFKNFGIGLGYHYFKVDVEANKTDWHGAADYSYHGPKLFMTFNF